MGIIKAGKTNWACGSALLSIFGKAFSPLFNERGEVAISDPNAGEGDGGEIDPNTVGSPPSGGNADGDQDGLEDDGASPAGAQNTDPNAQSTEGLDGQRDGEPPPPWNKDPRWVKFQEERKAMETEKASYEAQIEQASKIAEFYQTQFNEHLKATQAMRGQHPGAQRQPGQPAGPVPGAQPPSASSFKLDQLPPHIKGPGKWETQEDEAAYLDHMAGDIISNRVPHVAMQATKQVFDQIITPMIENFTNQMQDMQEAFARQANPDYDDVIKSANEAIFTLGPDGKVFGVKNPALLSYIRAQKNPYLALYNHGLTIKAPNKIKAGIDKATKQALRAIGAKPSGPTRPTSSSSQVPEADLDWNTPPKQAEKVLAKRGLL